MINIILSLNVIVLVFVINFLLLHRKRIIELQERASSLEKTSNQINKDHPMLINADLFFSKQIKEITQQLISMDNQIQELANVRQNDGAYEHALRILEMGGSREEIVNSCHLSNAEADLLMNLQAYRTAINQQT
ncbi:DUF2802 domain-containing protein [Legionella waltersii]|uniref:DUF2802 domain-containing protein n=1 Tax=Legionella waltersii TaxID=66969 RepID=A0A0W1AAK4_9GAMM|nr:DUF2802 domain-containing protein [Legionella waltersii]KTD78389.1 hypothetical protein Lwal_1824 [Legionella waltersii]SNV06299.1 Protein of uncharacterised function (DUF2802) [Legionella waltersii]